MSAIIHQDYASVVETGGSPWTRSLPFKRLVIAAAGCALMALSGTGLASYLDMSSATGPSPALVDAPPLN